MPKYKFRCSNEECGSDFDIQVSASDYSPEQICPDCSGAAKRVFTTVSIHHGRTLAQKKSGASLKTIEHGKHMKDAREKRKRNYDPTSREAKSNELWVGSEISDGVIDAPEKNKRSKPE
jgi:putative FmdB family regulatory protein